MKEIVKYIEYGITISKTDVGYRVFTIPTQHFNISSLEELTPKRFEEEIEQQKKCEETQADLLVRSMPALEVDWQGFLDGKYDQNKDDTKKR